MAGSGAAFTRASGALAKIQSLSTSLASRISGSDGASRIASGDTAGGALWTTMAGFITALLGGQVTLSLPTRAQMVANPVPSAITTIATSGFASSGDGGGATYVRATGPFSDGTSFQSQDGAWWQFQPNDKINAQAFGVVADGFSFANGTISAGALTKLVLASAGWKASAVTVGNAITVIGGASGGGSLITTIAAISGNTITLTAPVQAAMTSVCGNFGTDNTAAWAKIVEYALSLVNTTSAKTFVATDVHVRLPFGIMCFTGTLAVPDYVSLTGWGSRGSKFLAMSATAQMTIALTGYGGTSGAFGQHLTGFSVHGNNITASATGLVHSGSNGALWSDVCIWWSLADGLYGDATFQNNQLNDCFFANNGNPGASFYTFTVSGITTAPAAGVMYTNNSQSFGVVSSSIAAGAGTVLCVGSGAPTAHGTLANNNHGPGDASVAFSAFTGGGQTGANIRLTNTASTNIFIRCERAGTANYGIVIEGGCGANVFDVGECEYFKGQYSTEYYPAPLTINSTITNLLCDGGAGAQPYGYDLNVSRFDASSLYNVTNGRAIPHAILRNGGVHIFDSVQYSGDGVSANFIQFGPHPTGTGQNTAVCQGTNLVVNNNTLFYDAHSAAGKAVVQVLGQFSGSYTTLFNPGVTGSSVDSVVSMPVGVALALNGGHIAFPATQNPSTDPFTMDDYREDAPFVTTGLLIGGSNTGLTYTAYCNYTKNNQQVDAKISISITAIGSLTGAITIPGLPMAASSVQGITGGATVVNLTGVALGMGNQLIGSIAGGGTTLALQLSGASGTSAATQAILSLPTTIDLLVQYRAAA